MAEELQMRTSAFEFFDATSAPAERVFASAAPTSLTLSNPRVVREFETFVAQVDWQRPVFAYVNLQSAHFPYHYPGMPTLLDIGEPLSRGEISATNKVRLEHTYLNAIANADLAVGQIVAKLRDLGRWNDTLLVVSGDHGESLFDDGLLGHGHQLNDIQTRTLLVANQRLPGLSGLLGQTDLSIEMLEGIGARVTAVSDQSVSVRDRDRSDVFQIVGSLDNPAAIGFVDADRKRVALNMTSREAYFDSVQRWIPVANVSAYPNEAERLKRLVNHWEALRWEQWLARRKSQ